MSRTPISRSGAAVTPAALTSLDTRARIAAAAFELFAAQGYDGTTVDAIAEQAGIARRTFFRYFRSKDDVIFPDHDTMLELVSRQLQAALSNAPVEAVCGAVRLVFHGYLAEHRVAVQRYRLTRSVAALRDREIASVHRYERTFGRYLREQYRQAYPETQAVLRADVVAAAVVAAHNAVLREWLRAGGQMDPLPPLDEALSWVVETYELPLADASAPRGPSGLSGPAGSSVPAGQSDDGADVVVAVFRADQSINDVMERITRSL